MAGTGFSFSSATSSSSSPFSFPSSAATSSSPAFSSSTSTPSSSPFSFASSNPNSTSAGAPSSSLSFGFGNFGATNTSSSSASASPTPAAFASSTATASSAPSQLFGSLSSGSGFTPGLFGSGSSASTASSTGLQLFGAASLGSSVATSSSFGFGSSAPSSASAPTNIFGSGSGSSGSIFGSTASSGSGSAGSTFVSTAASSAFGSSAPSPASVFGAASSASTSPFPTGRFSSASSPLGVSSSALTMTTPSFSSFGSSASSGLGSAPSTPASSFPSGTISVSSAPSFVSPAASAASSTATASGFGFPATTAASSASLGQAFSFQTTSSASSASSVPGFSFPFSSGSSAASSSVSISSFLASSAPAFSFSKGTGSSATTTVSAATTPSLTSLSSLAASSSGFSFGTSGFQIPSSAPAFSVASASKPSFGTITSAPALSAALASKPSFGTTTSPLFSTVTTTISSSTPAATSATSAAASASIGGTGLAPSFSACGPAASSAATTVSTSGSANAQSGLTGFGVTSTSTPSGTTIAATSSFSLSTKLPAAGSSSQPQSTATAPLSGTFNSLAGTSSGCSAFCLRIGLVDEEEEEVESEGEQVREESVLEQPLVQINDCETNHDEFPGVGQDHAGKSECVKDVGSVEQDCESSAVACSTTIHVEELEAIPTVVPEETILVRTSSVESAFIGDTANIRPPVEDMGKQQPSKDIAEGQEETSENSSVVSGVVGDEAGVSNAVDQAFSIFTHGAGLNNLTLSPSYAQLIIKSILDKHGDITKGSIVKSLVMRSTLMLVVAEVVHRLCNHTMNTLGSDEFQLMQRLADDAAAVGFSVDWLQERLTIVSMASKYHECLVHLERLGEQINAAKKSLMEMELQQLVWKKEVDFMKVELEGIDFEGSNLGVPTLASTTAASPSTSSAPQTSSLVVASSSGTASTTATAVVAMPKLPSEITGKTVEEIIKEWNTELQERTWKFQKQANAIAEWDRRILQNRDILLKLETDVAKVVETQANLERQLELIETHQDEVDKALQSMEEEAERIYRDERGLLLDDEAASTRDAMYEQAEFIERELEHMTEQIKAIINTLNASQGGELEAAEGMTPLDVVVRILNNQLSSLMWIDEKAEEFSSRIQKLASQGSVVDREIMSPKFWLT